MARISGQILFMTTSPRTPEKMIPEIEILAKHFSNRAWDTTTQCEFMKLLKEEEFFHGEGKKDPAFSARDRINRAPKSLGFVNLKPVISLTSAGRALVESSRKEEVFLRQLLKFQIPSPYHRPTKAAARFCVKPYLEILRLIRKLGTLKFDELQMFGMRLTDWHDFDAVVSKIEKFRIAKATNRGNYRVFKAEYLNRELKQLFSTRISSGNTKTRESSDRSLGKFLRTQASNSRDYADACFRYLRATGLVSVSHIGKSLSIVSEKISDVDFILKTVDRNPVAIDDEEGYAKYLGDANTPQLLTDNKDLLVKKLSAEFPAEKFDIHKPTNDLKELFSNLLEHRKETALASQVSRIKNYELYDEIQNTFAQLEGDSLYDAPLVMEWNTWRAMTMLDGGDVKANLNFDDYGNPLSHASGNMPDIICDYGDYLLCVEVTLSSGQRQYEMEGEPVLRHLGKIKKSTGKPCYCLFIAPKINEACVVYFYTLHLTNLPTYGGEIVIVPMEMRVFQQMVENSRNASYVPSPSNIRTFFEHSMELAKSCGEKEWYTKITEKALKWLE